MGDVITDEIIAALATLGTDLADQLAADLRRRTAETAAIVPVMTLKAVSSGNMADGFGPSLQFYIRDNAGVDNLLVELSAYRSGADNTGIFQIHTNSAGSLNLVARFLASGAFFYKNLTAYNGVFSAGVSGSTRGAITAFHGSGGNTPGYLLTYSPNGTPWYWFASDSGIARISSTPPAANTDGFIIGLQF